MASLKKASAKKHYSHYDVYIYKVLKQVHPDTGISGSAMRASDELVHHIIRRIMMHANAARGDRATITSRDIQTGVRLALPGELAKHAVSEGGKAVSKFATAKRTTKKQTKQELAGLQFSVSRVGNEMRKCTLGCKCRLAAGSSVYLAAVVEYLIAEILELSGNAARENKRTRITPRHIFLAIQNDEELSEFFKHTIITSGVIPNIHAALIPKKKEGGGEKKKAAPKKKAAASPKKKKAAPKGKKVAAPKGKGKKATTSKGKGKKATAK